MNVSDAETGRVLDLGDRLEARLERIIDHDRRGVWRMLTDPRAIVNWLAPAEIDARKGGRIQIDFGESGAVIDSVISEFDPPGLISYSWSSGDEPARPLRWQLESLGTETRLALTVRLPGDEDIVKAAAGWDAHLEMLLAALEGVPIRFPVDHFIEARRFYGDQLQR
jgi:uncharacterized protein YndB with AHSA1/START domain